MSSPEDTVRVLRVVEYIGPRSWVEQVISHSIHGVKTVGSASIRAATIGEFPEILSPGASPPSTIQEE